MNFLENIDKEILQNIVIDKILYPIEFGISKRASDKVTYRARFSQ